MRGAKAKLLLMFQIGYLQGKVNYYEQQRPQTKPSENKHQTIDTTQPKMICSLEKQTEVEENTERKKYRTKQ